MKVDITIALSVYNSEKHIYPCIKSLLAQTIRDFEILIIEDPPFDQTKNIIDTFKDKRIRYLRNQKHLGLYKTRNRCIQRARGKYTFFTDDDCVVSENWLEQGLKSFLKTDCVGVEGKTHYVSKEYKPTYSDSVIENKKGGQFMTCNMAYKKSVIGSIGGFDERYPYNGDRDLALRVTKLGRICFNPEMIVYHQKVTVSPMQYIRMGKRIRSRVLLYKRFRDRSFLLWRLVYPLNLMVILFPPLTLGSFFRNRYKTNDDFALFSFNYIRLIYERLSLWHMCIKERVFLI